MGLPLSPEKTLITRIDEGLDFLGWRIQRHRKRGTSQHYVYTYPARTAVTDKVNPSVAEQAPNCRSTLCSSSSTGCCGGGGPTSDPECRPRPSNTCSHHAWQQVMRWLRRKHHGITWKAPRRRFCGGRWWPADEDRQLFDPKKVSATRYRYWGANIPSPLAGRGMRNTTGYTRDLWSARCSETGTPGAGSGPGKHRSTRPAPRPGPASPCSRALPNSPDLLPGQTRPHYLINPVPQKELHPKKKAGSWREIAAKEVR
ncbi:hypothetical protein Aros01_08636 [Streptosporangium roseum]